MVKFVTNFTVVQFCYILYMHYSQEALLKIPGKCKLYRIRNYSH
jgi:hypothetical protein